MNVLFVVFNRPDVTGAVMSGIRQARPSSLYVFADGPRDDREGDERKCREVRSIVCEQADARHVHFEFMDSNLGPLHSMKRALDWFFTHEDEGIVIEDDCLPDLSFFPFCQELLSKYRAVDDVFMVSGSNFVPRSSLEASYTFSRLALIWGWATWKRAWNKFDMSMEAWSDYSKSGDLTYFGDQAELVFSLIDRQYRGVDPLTWGVVWRATILTNRGLSIVPRNNLVTNIGFGHPDATHHQERHKVSRVPVKSLSFPLTHPKERATSQEFDRESLRFYYAGLPHLQGLGSSERTQRGT